MVSSPEEAKKALLKLIAKTIITTAPAQLKDALNSIDRINTININDIYQGEIDIDPNMVSLTEEQLEELRQNIRQGYKILKIAADALDGKIVALLESNVQVGLNAAQHEACAEIALSQGVFDRYISLQCVSGFPHFDITHLYASNISPMVILMVAISQGQLGSLLAHCQNSISLHNLLISPDYPYPIDDKSLAVFALAHGQFEALVASRSITDQVRLDTTRGEVATYYALVVNQGDQLPTLLNNAVGYLNVNAVVSDRMHNSAPDTLISIAARHDQLSKFLRLLIDNDTINQEFEEADEGQKPFKKKVLDLAMKGAEGKVLVDHFMPQDHDLLEVFANREQLCATCNDDNLNRVVEFLSANFSGIYFRLDILDKAGRILTTGSGKDPEGKYIYAVQPHGIDKVIEEYNRHLSNDEAEKDIFYYIQPALEPEYVTVESLMARGIGEEDARKFLGEEAFRHAA